MAQRIQARSIPVPAGTLSTAPQSTDLSFNPGIVNGLEVFVPSGHAGLTGWAIAQGKTQIIPETPDPFFVMDSDTVKWPLEGYLDSGNWQFLAFNTDVYSHTFYVRFLINEIDLSGPQVPIVRPLTIRA